MEHIDMGHVEAVTQKCPGCMKVADGFFLSEGKFVCPNCVHPAVFQRWQNEWKPIEDSRIAAESRRLMTLQAKLKEAVKKRSALGARKALRELSDGVRSKQFKIDGTKNISPGEKYELLSSLRTHADIQRLRQQKINADTDSASLFGLGVAILGFADDDPYLFAGGLAIQNSAQIDGLRRSVSNALSTKQVLPVNSQLVQIIVASDKSRRVLKQPIAAQGGRKRFHADVHDAYELEGSIFGQVSLRKLLKSNQNVAYEYEVKFDERSGFWLIMPFCMACGKCTKDQWVCKACVPTITPELARTDEQSDDGDIDAEIESLRDEISSLSPIVKDKKRTVVKPGVWAIAISLLLFVVLAILWPRKSKNSDSTAGPNNNKSAHPSISKEQALEYVKEFETNKQLEQFRRETEALRRQSDILRRESEARQRLDQENSR